MAEEPQHQLSLYEGEELFTNDAINRLQTLSDKCDWAPFLNVDALRGLTAAVECLSEPGRSARSAKAALDASLAVALEDSLVSDVAFQDATRALEDTCWGKSFLSFPMRKYNSQRCLVVTWFPPARGSSSVATKTTSAATIPVNADP